MLIPVYSHFDSHCFKSTTKGTVSTTKSKTKLIKQTEQQKAKGIGCFCNDGSSGNVISIPARSRHNAKLHSDLLKAQAAKGIFP